jgi:hypothetical protein
MNSKNLLSIVFAVVFACAALPLASAEQANQLTKVTFTQSVEIPGRVLPAGTYWLELVGDTFNRNTVRIYSADMSTVYLTQVTVSNQHQNRADGTAITFAERNASQPEALLEWRCSGEAVGHEFQYNKTEQRELAQDRRETVLANRAGL